MIRNRDASHPANPLVGIYFGIFTSALVAVVLLLSILEQLGVATGLLKLGMVVATLALCGLIGVGGYTRNAREFMTASRRVPAFYNGIAIAVTALGGAGLAGFAGALFLTGYDVLFMGLGIVAGLTVSVVLIAPFLRKHGAPTVPGYLGQRFESGPLRLLAAMISVVALLLLAMAEIKMAVIAMGWLLPLSPAVSVALVLGTLFALLLPGGVRSQAWSSAAQAIAVLLAIIVPASIAAVMETNLPFGQLSHGPLVRAVGRAEALQNVPIPVAGLLALDVPGFGLQPVAGRFTATFGSVGLLAFPIATLCVMAGIAGSPGLLSRSAVAPTVYDARKAIGWAVAVVGLLVTTVSAIAVFERDNVLSALAGQPAGLLSAKLAQLVEIGMASVEPTAGKLGLAQMRFDRDAMLVALPVLMGLPGAMVHLVAAGLLWAALAAASLSICQLGIVIGEDVVGGSESWRASDRQRINMCRIAMAVSALVAGGGASLIPGDPLILALHSLVISGSALFPILVLSVWWKRINATGAFAGLAAGFLLALAALVAADLAPLGVPALLGPMIGVPVAVAVAMGISHLTPKPGRHMLEIVRDIRVPGGESVVDRAVRQARQRSSTRQ